ncbi:LysR family transcriptional regulator, partial [Stenotrophomonas sp. 3diitr2024]|uniref:LysR family transcriptional regulator n=1 Tax=Stenotrophomonas sp. 3diitr2024 TaxID=3345115 RepID=UPI0035CB7C54
MAARRVALGVACSSDSTDIISRSAVGKAIARLEARLGVRLFHRTTRRIALTSDGEAYYASCAAAL